MVVRPQDRQGVRDVFLWVRLGDVLCCVSLVNKRSREDMGDLRRLVRSRGVVIRGYFLCRNVVDDEIRPTLISCIIVLDGVVYFDVMGNDER